MDMNDAQLDQLLRARHSPPPSVGLAERISMRAAQVPQRRESLLTRIARIFAEFHVPQPAYALACTVVLGAFIGIALPVASSQASVDDMPELQSFLYAEENLL